MNDEDKLALYLKAIAKWGSPLQIVMAIEESAELTQALTKYMRGKITREVISNISEEMADLEIMLEQLKVIFCNEHAVSDAKAQKLQRLEEMVKMNG